MIEVYDDFFSVDIHEQVFNELSTRPWTFSGGGTKANYDTEKYGQPPLSRFWHIDFLEKEEFFNKYLFDIICQKLNKSFNYKRIYANGQTSTQDGVPHTDDGDITLLYYPNPEWKVHYAGHLIFLDGDEIIKTVSYKPNRVVLFSSKIWHCALAPSIQFKFLRMSLAYKLLLK